MIPFIGQPGEGETLGVESVSVVAGVGQREGSTPKGCEGVLQPNGNVLYLDCDSYRLEGFMKTLRNVQAQK